MKKRLLSLLFAVITIFNMMPWGVMASETENEANDPVPLDVSELEMGKLYSATFDYEYDEMFIPLKEDESDPGLLEWKGYGEGIDDYEAYVPKSDFPKQLIVRLYFEDDSEYVYVTNEDWPEEYNEYRIIDIADIIISGEYVAPNPPAEGEIVYGEVGLTVGGKTVENLVIAKGDKVYVSADLSDAITGTPTYIWQLLIDSANDVWAVIQDYIYPYAVVSEALIANAGIDGGNVTLRCVAEWNGASYVSSELGISVSESYPDEAPVSDYAASVEPISYNNVESAGDSKVALLSTRTVTEEYPKVAKLAARVVTEAFQIQIDYIFKHASSSNNGDKAAQAVTVTIPEGAEEYSGTIPSTPVVGYLPVVSAENSGYIKLPAGKVLEDLKTTYNGENYYIADTLELIDINGKTSITVYYIPQEVNFRVFIYEQQLYTDGYDLAGTVTKTGISDTAVGEGLSESRTGFTPLYYDPETVISGDGTTVVKLYYDRNYYLVKFDLNDTDKGTAYGATPYYVRYNTQVMLPTPTLPGYDFTGWELTSVYEGVKTNGSSETVPGAQVIDSDILALYDQKDGGKLITVQHIVNYKASWVKSTTSYTIVYWLENADSTDSTLKTNYDVWYTYNVEGKTTGSYTDSNASKDSIKTYVTTNNGFKTTEVTDVTSTYRYLKYESSLSDTTTKVIAGDGSTAINIYYSRNQYTFKFYYAIEDTLGNANDSDNLYYVIGGTTDGFAETNSSDDLALINRYRPNGGANEGDIGTVGIRQNDNTVKNALPTLNEEGLRRYGSTLKYSTYNNNNRYRYYYISFDAKYGADISNKWPCDVFNSVVCTEKNTNNPKNGWSGTTAVVSGWTGEYNVKYSRDNSNNTIKGNYTRVDDNLFWSSGMPTDNTFAFACFWENGAESINWNIPKLFRYKLWLPVLDGQSYATTIEHRNQTYYLHTSYDTCDDSAISGQTQPALVGFEHLYAYVSDSQNYGANVKDNTNDLFVVSNPPLGVTAAELADLKDTNNSYTSDYANAYVFNVFYTRKTYTIEYDSGYNEPITETVSYGATLNTDDLKKENFGTTNYPSAFEAGEYEFAGWYIDEACQIAFDFNTTMPAKNIMLYAKWNKLSYTAKVYLDSSKTELLSEQTVLFGTGITVPDYKDNDKYKSTYKDMIFSGWYYMDGSEEKRFDFNTMVIKQDLDIYAKWTSHVPVQYTVYYVVLKDDHSVNIADPMEGECLAGESKTFAALMGTDLYEDYRVGYFPKSRSTSKVMSSTEVNEIIFEYYIPTHLEYTVEHEFVNDDFIDIIGVNTIKLSKTIKIDGDSVKTQSANLTISFLYGITVDTIAAATEKSLNDTEKTKLYNIVTQMSPDYIQQDIILVPEDKNIVKFNWADRGLVSTYQVVYYSQTLDANGIQNGYKVDYTLTFVGEIAADGAQPGDPGYPKVEPPDKNGFIINVDKSITSGPITKATIGDNTSGLILKIYYDREVYSYTVHHYKQGTTVSIGGYGSGSGTACFGAIIKISDVAQSIDGYNLSNGTDSVEIVSDNQEIICYYTGKEVIYRYQIAVDTSGGTWDKYDAIAQTTIVGEAPESNTLKLFEGYYLKRWYYQIDDGAITDVPSGWLSADKMTLQPTASTADMANKTVTVYAEVLPTKLTITISETVEQGVVFNIIKNDNSFSMRVVVFEREVDVYGLTNGATYTVKRDPDWAWQYGVSPESYNNITIDQQNTRADFKLSPLGDGTTSGNNIVTDGAHNNQ